LQGACKAIYSSSLHRIIFTNIVIYRYIIDIVSFTGWHQHSPFELSVTVYCHHALPPESAEIRIASSSSYRETRFGAPVLGLPNSCITVLLLDVVLCCVPQEGVEETVGVCRKVPALDIDTMIGVRMLVGVRPVRPSIKALKSSVFMTLVGVSIGMLRLLSVLLGLTNRLEGRLAFALAVVVVMICCCSIASACVRCLTKVSWWTSGSAFTTTLGPRVTMFVVAGLMFLTPAPLLQTLL